MPLSVSFRGLTAEDVQGQTALNPHEVYFQYLCTTNDATGAHDPSQPPAPRVRPSHACFHGTIWRINDPRAPVPPCDYGCRCGIRYLSKPSTKAAKVMPPADAEPVQDAAAPVRSWLTDNVKQWPKIAAAAGPKGNLQAAVREARRLGIPQPTEIARMVIHAMMHKKDPANDPSGN